MTQFFRTIRTRYAGGTNTRGSRILATLSTGPRRLAVPYDCALSAEANHEVAARALYAVAYGWPGQPVPKPVGTSDATKGHMWHFAAVKGQP
jgi:hypothetical protein